MKKAKAFVSVNELAYRDQLLDHVFLHYKKTKFNTHMQFYSTIAKKYLEIFSKEYNQKRY